MSADFNILLLGLPLQPSLVLLAIREQLKSLIMHVMHFNIFHSCSLLSVFAPPSVAC